MRLERQPAGSNQCGQACVATICDITLDGACMLTRTEGRTSTKQLIQALTHMGMCPAQKLKRGMPESGLAMLKFTHPDGKPHWVVWENGKYYDPAAGVFRKVPNYLRMSRVTSHLRVEDKHNERH